MIPFDQSAFLTRDHPGDQEECAAMNIAMTERAIGCRENAQGQGFARHRLDQRHRARHRPGARGGGLGRRPQRLRQAGGDQGDPGEHRRGFRRAGRLFRRRHDQARADRRDGQDGARHVRQRSTSWSTMPASSTSRRCRSFRSPSGTRSSPSISARHSTPRGSRCPR